MDQESLNMQIFDLAVYDYSFWPLPILSREAFNEKFELEKAVNFWLEQNGAEPNAQIPEPIDLNGSVSYERIWPPIETGWKKRAGRLECYYATELFQIHDFVCLRKALAIDGELGLKELRELVIDFEREGGFGEIGISRVVVIGYQEEEDVAALASKLTNFDVRAGSNVSLGGGKKAWIVGSSHLSQTPYRDVVYLLAPKQQLEDGRHELDEVADTTLPNLFRLRNRALHQRDQARALTATGLLDRLEDKLDHLTKSTRESENSENDYEEFAASLREYSKSVSTFERLRISVESSYQNIQRATAKLARNNSEFGSAWISNFEKTVSDILFQMRSDFAYFDARMKQAQTEVFSLGVRNDFQRIRVEREMSYRSNVRTLALTLVGTGLAFSGLIDQQMAEATARMFAGPQRAISVFEVFAARISLVLAGSALSFGVIFLILRFLASRSR